eukprot:GILI01035581.1.p1 GENE.GILI01035581.1~~GILI01035581.1.p1  ORF type:complete len:317 (-),score=64.01 GILI01035581.1:73-1023(-)
MDTDPPPTSSSSSHPHSSSHSEHSSHSNPAPSSRPSPASSDDDDLETDEQLALRLQQEEFRQYEEEMTRVMSNETRISMPMPAAASRYPVTIPVYTQHVGDVPLGLPPASANPSSGSPVPVQGLPVDFLHGSGSDDSVPVGIPYNPNAPPQAPASAGGPTSFMSGFSIVPSSYGMVAAAMLQSSPQEQRLLFALQLSRSVKCFAVLDLFFYFIFLLGSPFLMILIVLPLCGYMGAKLYRRPLVGLYMVFTVLMVGLRLFLMFYYPSPLMIFLGVMGVIVELWVFRVVFRFFRHIRLLSMTDIAQLRQMQVSGGGFR